MINTQDKIDIITNKINNLEALIISLTNNAEICAGKYSLEDELASCNAMKSALLEALEQITASLD